ncbi:MAG TPA: transposase [Flavobacteriales bacterium]|nr:transposase [Flavobacteriales bacterium]
MNAKTAPFKRMATTRSEKPGERIHSDVNELPVRSKKGHKYAVCFIEDCTRRGMSYPMAKKSQVLDRWQQFLEEELLAKGRSCRYLRSDNGGEYIGEEMAA